jgi:aminoglycoside phosphotransferase (APT) family kinase protein
MASDRVADPEAGVVADLVAAHLPGYRVASVVRLGEGLDNVAYEVNGELIARFSKQPDPRRLDTEARLLATVAEVSPLPVPEPVFTAPERGCLTYAKLPGVPLLERPRDLLDASVTASIAARLGDLLAALHAVAVDRVADLVEPDDQPLPEWRQDAAGRYATLAERVPAAHRGPVEAFLAAPPPPGGWTPVFSHNDLGIEHVLVDPATSTVTGVIDWSDAAIVDPAYDFGLLYRDLGPAALAAATRGYRAGDLATLRDRAVFYARCSVFEDLAYGVETGRDAYVAKSLAALRWLFPASSASV